jgi:hypothetical protein
MKLTSADGRIFPLKVGVNTIGRTAENDIHLKDGSMSRRHAELHWDGRDQCVVVDLGSTNGTYLNGQLLRPGQGQLVHSGAALAFGPTMTARVTADRAGPFPGRPPASPRPSSSPARGLDLIFQALDVALDFRKLAVLFLGYLIAAAVGVMFILILTAVLSDSAVLAAAMALVGLLGLWAMSTFVTAVLSRLIIVELTQQRKGSLQEAMSYVGQNFLTFLLSPVVLGLGAALVLVGQFILLLIGRLDYLGEMLVALAFLPLVFLNLMVIVVVWFGAALIAPAVADQGRGIGATIGYVVQVVRREPVRLAAYMLLAGLASLLLFLFSLYLLGMALYTTLALTSVAMGIDKFVMVFSGLSLLIRNLPLDLLYLLPGGFSLREPPVTYGLAGLLFQLWLLALLVLALTVPRMLYLASACAVYLNLRQDVVAPGGPRGQAWG